MIDAILLFGGMILGLIGLVGVIAFSDYDGPNEFKVSLAMLAIGVAFIGTEIYVANKLKDQVWKRDNPYVTHTIMALQDGNEIQGNYRHRRYGMSGYINEEFMYVYGYKTYSGGMKIQKVSAKNAVVYFDDSVSPNAKWYRETKKFWWSESERYTCDIFIPTGSLQAEMVIDLQ